MGKRIFSVILGAGLAVATAGPAAAASHIDFSGVYRAYYQSDANLGRQAGDASFTDSYFGHRLEMNVIFTPVDNMSVHWRLRGPGFRRWGEGLNFDLATNAIYGSVLAGNGNFLIGRLSDDFDAYGLASLGWQPVNVPLFSNVSPFDDGRVLDGIRWRQRWANGWGLNAQYARPRTANGEGGTVDTTYSDEFPDRAGSDDSRDRWQVEGYKLWNGGGASLGVIYDRDAARGRFRLAPADIPVWGPAWPPEGRPVNDEYGNQTAWYVNPALRQNWGGFSVNFDGLWGRGRQDLSNGQARLDNIANLLYERPLRDHIDQEGLGLFFDVGYNYGPGRVDLAAWWVQGTDLDEGYTVDGEWDPGHIGKSKSLVNMGANFYPLIVAYNSWSSGRGRVGVNETIGVMNNGNAVSLANNAFHNYVRAGYEADDFLNSPGQFAGISILPQSRLRRAAFNNNTEANHWAVALSGKQFLSREISLSWAVAWLGLNEPNYRVPVSGVFDGGAGEWTNLAYADQDKDLGLEADLGLSIQLLDNLNFTTAFGYMWNGDAFRTMRGYVTSRPDAGGLLAAGDTFTAVWEDPKDTYVWYSTLTFGF